MVIKRFEIYWVNLDPTVGTEMQKTRPGIVVSPDEMNDFLGTVLVAPITSSNRNFPTRIKCKLDGKESFIALDHIRSVDKSRLRQKISVLSKPNSQHLCEVLQEMFAY
jgi:mRNA interferase MazF